MLQALGALGHQGRLVEWWQETPPAAPHTFRAEVEIDERGIDEDLARSIERQVAMTKPVRSHFILRLIAIGRAEVHVACAAIHGERTTVVPPIVSELQAGSPQYQAASLVTGESTTIMPPRRRAAGQCAAVPRGRDGRRRADHGLPTPRHRVAGGWPAVPRRRHGHRRNHHRPPPHGAAL
ncbi:phage tail protein I [Azotobacter vinelandii]